MSRAMEVLKELKEAQDAVEALEYYEEFGSYREWVNTRPEFKRRDQAWTAVDKLIVEGEADDELRHGWIARSERLPSEGQGCQWVPLSGSVFAGNYLRGRFYAPFKEYTEKVVTHWAPLRPPPMDAAASIESTDAESTTEAPAVCQTDEQRAHCLDMHLSRVDGDRQHFACIQFPTCEHNEWRTASPAEPTQAPQTRDEVIEATIERCAKVVDYWVDKWVWLRTVVGYEEEGQIRYDQAFTIAEAIRALKSQPSGGEKAA